MVRGKQYGYIWAGRLLEGQAAPSGLPTASAAPPPRLPRARGRASRAGGGRGCRESSPSAPPGRRRSQVCSSPSVLLREKARSGRGLGEHRRARPRRGGGRSGTGPDGTGQDRLPPFAVLPPCRAPPLPCRPSLPVGRGYVCVPAASGPAAPDCWGAGIEEAGEAAMPGSRSIASPSGCPSLDAPSGFARGWPGRKRPRCRHMEPLARAARNLMREGGERGRGERGREGSNSNKTRKLWVEDIFIEDIKFGFVQVKRISAFHAARLMFKATVRKIVTRCLSPACL